MKEFIFISILTVLVCLSHSNESLSQDKITKINDRPNEEFRKAQELELQKKYEEAKEVYERLFETDKSEYIFLKLIYLYDNMDDFEGMEKLANDRLKENPDDISTVRYLAHAYYEQGDEKNGRKTLLKIIGDRWYDHVRIFLVTSELSGQNDFDTALEVYTTAREKQGNPALFANEMARIYSIRLEYIKAIEEYVKILDTDDDNINITYYNIQQMIEKAIEDEIKPDDISRPLALYLERNPKSIKVARLLSDMKYESGDYNGAYRVLLTTAVVSNNPEDLWNLARRFRGKGRMQEALTAFEDFCRYFKNDLKCTSALLEVASIKALMGNTEGAIDYYHRLAEEYNGSLEAATASLRIIELSRTKMDFEEFSQTLRDFASSTPYRTVALEAYVHLGENFLRVGCSEDARKAFDDARIKSRTNKETYDVAKRMVWLTFFTGDYKSMSEEINKCVENNPEGEEINEILELKILGLKCSSESDMKRLHTYAQGQYAYYKGEVSTAIDSFIVAAHDTSSIVAYYAARALAEQYHQQGDSETSATWFLHAASVAHDSTEHVAALKKAADIYAFDLNNRTRAGNLYRETLLSYPGTVYESELRNKLRKVMEE